MCDSISRKVLIVCRVQEIYLVCIPVMHVEFMKQGQPVDFFLQWIMPS